MMGKNRLEGGLPATRKQGIGGIGHEELATGKRSIAPTKQVLSRPGSYLVGEHRTEPLGIIFRNARIRFHLRH